MTAVLVIRFASGDSAAFDRLFQLFAETVAMVVRRYFSGAFDQDDAFQEVWVQLRKKAGRMQFQGAEQFESWVKEVARNRCVDLLRARGRRARLADDLHREFVQDVGLVDQLPDQWQRRLECWLKTLPDDQQQFFQLCFVQERNHDEIASILGITQRQSKYAKKKMLALLLASDPIQLLRGESCTSKV